MLGARPDPDRSRKFSLRASVPRLRIPHTKSTLHPEKCTVSVVAAPHSGPGGGWVKFHSSGVGVGLATVPPKAKRGQGVGEVPRYKIEFSKLYRQLPIDIS